MKKIFSVAVAIIGLSALVASAQMMPGGGQGQQPGGGGMGGGQGQQPGGGGMGGGQGQQPGGGMMGSQPSSQMMGGQTMMQQDMMRDMMGMIGQMDQAMQKMSRGMEGQVPMDRMQQMSRGMGELSVTMKEMSEHMATGTMDPTTTKAMQERIKNLNQTIDNQSKQGK